MLGTLPGQDGEVITSVDRYRRARAWGYGAKIIAVSINAQATGQDYLVHAATSHWTEDSFAYRLPAMPPSLDLQRRLGNMDDARSETLDLICSHAVRDVDNGWALAVKHGEVGFLELRRAIEAAIQ